MAEELELKVPSVGESIKEVQVGKWHKSVGQHVEKDENVVELESDKATVDLPAPATGTISKILKQSGQTAAVGEVIGYVVAGAQAAASQAQRHHRPLTPPKPDGQSTAPAAPAAPAPTSGMTVSVEKRKGQTAIGSVQAAASSPAAPPPRRRVAAAAPLSCRPPNGRWRSTIWPRIRFDRPARVGVCSKEDVIRHLEPPAAKSAPPAPPTAAKPAATKPMPVAAPAERTDIALSPASNSSLRAKKNSS